jgi:large subunit ribosomal protein L31
MKEGIHPEYDHVIFHDTSGNKSFLIRSTYKSKQTMKWHDGKDYPVCYLDVSSATHPFYTGKQTQAKSDGRVAKFNQKFKISSSKKDK